MATPSRTSQRVRFGEFELDLSTRELSTNGSKQTLAPQPFQVLQLLIENRGQLVSHESWSGISGRPIHLSITSKA